MTVSVGGAALGLSIEQVDRITLATDVIPIPESLPEHLGLIAHQDGYVPLLALEPRGVREEELVVIVQVRGEPVGLSIDETGRVYSSWSFLDSDGRGADSAEIPSPGARAPGAQRAQTAGQTFWWVDTDRLWENCVTREG